MLRFAAKKVTPEERVKREELAKKIQQMLVKRYGERAGECLPSQGDYLASPDLIVTVYKGAPKELLTLSEGEELLEALNRLWNV